MTMFVNVANVNRLIDRLKEEGREIKMASWVSNNNAPVTMRCRAPMCIAGHASHIWLSQDAALSPDERDDWLATTQHYEGKGREFLGLDLETASRLFYMSGVLTNQVQSLFEKCKLPIYFGRPGTPTDMFDRFPIEVRRAAAIEVLRRLALTGSVDWLAAINVAVRQFVARTAPADCG